MLRALFSLILVFLCAGRAQAIGIWDYTHRADLICVATVDSLRPAAKEPSPALSLDDLKKNPDALTPSFGVEVTYAVTMNVREVWKGKWTEPQMTVYLSSQEFSGPIIPAETFEPFAPNRKYLIFAKKNPNNRFANSRNDLNGEQGFLSYFAINESVPAEPNQPVMTRITRQLIANLFSANSDIKKRALGDLIDYEGVFIDGPSWIKNQFPTNKVSATKALVQAKAIPEILRVAREGDDETREVALRTASWLQQTSIIPQLAQEAQKGKPWSDSVAWGLLNFRNHEALPLLRAQLGNTNPLARLAIVEAFEGFRDPIVIPDLKKLLADPDKGVSKRAAYALGLLGG